LSTLVRVFEGDTGYVLAPLVRVFEGDTGYMLALLMRVFEGDFGYVLATLVRVFEGDFDYVLAPLREFPVIGSFGQLVDTKLNLVHLKELVTLFINGCSVGGSRTIEPIR
jgi:hypothetical protein